MAQKMADYDIDQNETQDNEFQDESGLAPEVQEAIKRFKECQDFESVCRQRYLDDMKFDAADSYNNFQWPDAVLQARIDETLPCLTINMVRQHNLKIINDAKQNTPSIAIRPTGGEATYQAAQVYGAICRRIEYKSQAKCVYDTATGFQVRGGIGYWRVVTDYMSPKSFDQEIFIRAIPDPLAVYMDPNIKQKDGSDANFCFIFDEIPRAKANKKWGKYKDAFSQQVLADHQGWFSKDTVRVAEYFRKKEVSDTLLQFVDPVSGEEVTAFASELSKEALDAVKNDPAALTRATARMEIEWMLILGTKVVERRIWPGKYIPVVRVPGEEYIIDGVYDRKGHTRAMLDPQRMYNYWQSAGTQKVALDPISPFIAPAEAIEDYQDTWKDMNVSRPPVLPYKAYTEDGQKMDPPQKAPESVYPQAMIAGMQMSRQELMFVSGQYENQMGEPGNERTGQAINARQRQGDNATYHFVDTLALAIRFTGIILIDLIPKIYDTRRVMLMTSEEGEEYKLEIDPQAPQALQEFKFGEQITRVFNPNVGEYEVEVDVGPAYATRRQEAFNAIQLILTQSPDLVGMIGDLLFKSADFPMADQIAQRLRRAVPPNILGEGPSPQEQELKAQLDSTNMMLQQFSQEMAKMDLKLAGKEQLRDIDAFNAETKRMDTLMKAGALDQSALKDLVRQLVQETLQTSLLPVVTSAQTAIGGQLPQEMQRS